MVLDDHTLVGDQTEGRTGKDFGLQIEGCHRTRKDRYTETSRDRG